MHRSSLALKFLPRSVRIKYHIRVLYTNFWIVIVQCVYLYYIFLFAIKKIFNLYRSISRALTRENACICLSNKATYSETKLFPNQQHYWQLIKGSNSRNRERLKMEALLRVSASNKTSAIRASLKSVRHLQYRTENVIPA